MISLNKFFSNPKNPRFIRDERFEKLKKSISEFPKMMALRPIIVDEAGMILGGNMRHKALQELGFKEIPEDWVKPADQLTEDEKRRFIIEDNVPFGEWDYEILANEWDEDELSEWGLIVPNFEPDPDYDLLNESDVSNQLSEMSSGVKKAIQIEFENEHYEEAYQLVKYWREKNGYVGGMIMEYLKSEKEKI